MAEFNLRSSIGGQEEKMSILDKDGSIKTECEYETISLDAGRYVFGALPYFVIIPKINEIIYGTEGLCGKKTYMIWHNMLYAPGFSETLTGEAHLNLATSELEQIDQFFFRNSVSETTSKSKLTV